jgi:hypothetical protein
MSSTSPCSGTWCSSRSTWERLESRSPGWVVARVGVLGARRALVVPSRRPRWVQRRRRQGQRQPCQQIELLVLFWWAT